MLKRIKPVFYLIFINSIVFILLLAAIEMGFRWFGRDKVDYGPGIYAQVYQPYLMFSNSPTGNRNAVSMWNDIYRNVRIHAEQGRNNYGFRMDDDVDFVKEYKKQPNERLVLITGGSAVHGVGATKNETNMGAWIEKVLNEKQSKYRYKVLNFAIGASVAYQEYLALSLWGKWMDPDWVVVMDGHNDIAVCSAHSQGAVYPMYYHHIRSYVEGYLSGQANPSFYRGWLENQIIKYSYAYRSITKKQYVPRNQYISNAEGWARVGTDVKWEDIERQIVFYLHAQELIVGLSNRAKYILSLQPVTLSFSNIFGMSKEELDGIADVNRGASVGGPGPYYQAALPYFMCRAELGLKELTQKYSKEVDIQYINMGSYLPADFEDRKQYLIDNMHLNDNGHELVGKAYAYHILMIDFPERKLEISQELDSMLRKVNAVSLSNIGAAPGIHVLEATYGWNCRDMKPPIGRNTVRRGNATRFAKKIGDGKMNAEIFIDATVIGDPANSCGKEFHVKWRCGKEEKVYEAFEPGEANGKKMILLCPAKGK